MSPQASLAHRRIASSVAHELAQMPDVQAVLLAGSVARQEHTASSDVDLLIVGDDPAIPFRQVVEGVLVECISHDAVSWKERFYRAGTSWLYSFLDAEVLEDGSGVAVGLVARAHEIRSEYCTPDVLKTQLATSLHHGRAKLDRAAVGSPAMRGYWASVCTETVLDALYAVHDAPLPAGSRRLEHLEEVGLVHRERVLVDVLLDATTEHRFAALRTLLDIVVPQLDSADHESSSH